jgi:LytS/YehU family sensor histidine kinase
MELRPPAGETEAPPAGMPPEQRLRPLLNRRPDGAQFDIPIYWIVVGIAHAFSLSRRAQERERSAAELTARLAEARLQALRMQLHPHFLFNTLNAITTLVHKDPRAADEMIGNLSELLRATLDTSGQEVPLSREFDFLNRYLEIQRVRFGDRLRVEREIDAAALSVRVPTLILQPLVENAIRYGIEPYTAPGLIQITASRTADTLRLRVRNTGGPGAIEPKPSTGIGIANTQARLQALYGHRARMTLSKGASGDFTADVEIPLEPQAAAGG